MCVKRFCHKLLSNTSIHAKRKTAITEIVTTILTAKTLSVTNVGRKLKNGCQSRSNIRKADRLYSNINLYAEREEIYAQISQHVIKTQSPFILIDGSKVPNSPWSILRASVYTQGRAITLYEYQYEQVLQGDRKLYHQFLLGLQGVLGAKMTPVLITDAEFRAPWFKLVRELGWDFIGRIRGNANVALGEGIEPDDWHDVWDRASSKPKALGAGYYNKQDELEGYFYLYKAPNKKRHAHTRSGCYSKTIKSLRHKNDANEPWLLISSLNCSARYIVTAYQFRMTIEENFRDTKSGRYGLGLKMTFSKQRLRYAIMLLLAAIASMIAYLVGTVAEHKQLHRQFQANSTRKRRVLSRFFLGCEVIYKNMPISMVEFQSAIDTIQQETLACFL